MTEKRVFVVIAKGHAVGVYESEDEARDAAMNLMIPMVKTCGNVPYHPKKNPKPKQESE